MTQKDRKFLFDRNIFDPPEPDEIPDDLPPPPPTFSEEELGAAKDIAFEQGRQQGQKEQTESREQFIAKSLEKIAQNFSHLFAAEAMRESVFEKEALHLTIEALDRLFPSLNEKVGADEVRKAIQKTLTDHRKTKEITIRVATGMRGEIEAMISRIRADEHEDVLWRVIEDAELSQGDCSLEWSDGGAVRDSRRAAADIRRNIEKILGKEVSVSTDIDDSEPSISDVLSKEISESQETAEKNDE